jgi:hypothetical protein
MKCHCNTRGHKFNKSFYIYHFKNYLGFIFYILYSVVTLQTNVTVNRKSLRFYYIFLYESFVLAFLMMIYVQAETCITHVNVQFESK